MDDVILFGGRINPPRRHSNSSRRSASRVSSAPAPPPRYHRMGAHQRPPVALRDLRPQPAPPGRRPPRPHRVLTSSENGNPEGRDALRHLFPHSGQAQVIGITGPTGSGKSTLVGASPAPTASAGGPGHHRLSTLPAPSRTGALLGDRIRMQDLTSDPGVFIRSMATRGRSAVSRPPRTTSSPSWTPPARTSCSSKQSVRARTRSTSPTTAHTTVVISIPGAGDDMQAIKAGILEIADILVVNKADLPFADTVVKQLHIL